MRKKKSELVVVRSTMRWGKALSIRGAGHTDARDAIRDGGFEVGDEVVLITKKHYEELIEG